MDKYSFRKGYEQLQMKDVEQARDKIMKVLNIKTLQGFRNRLNGIYEPKISEVDAIENIFNEYGIFEVWGVSNEKECEANKA